MNGGVCGYNLTAGKFHLQDKLRRVDCSFHGASCWTCRLLVPGNGVVQWCFNQGSGWRGDNQRDTCSYEKEKCHSRRSAEDCDAGVWAFLSILEAQIHALRRATYGHVCASLVTFGVGWMQPMLVVSGPHHRVVAVTGLASRGSHLFHVIQIVADHYQKWRGPSLISLPKIWRRGFGYIKATRATRRDPLPLRNSLCP